MLALHFRRSHLRCLVCLGAIAAVEATHIQVYIPRAIGQLPATPPRVVLRLGTTTVYDNLVRSEKSFQTNSEKRELRRKN